MLVEGKQPPYKPIFSLSLVEMETLKTFIETHLQTGFLRSLKSLTGASLLFQKRLRGTWLLAS